MSEDLGLCTYAKHHKQKIVLFLASMRSYADGLVSHGAKIHYSKLEEQSNNNYQASYEEKLIRFLDDHGKTFKRMITYEIEDKFFESRMIALAEKQGMELVILPSPMFLTSREAFDEYLGDRKPFMAKFYSWQRKRLDILLEPDGTPIGGQWSFDDENRKKLPKYVELPDLTTPEPDPHAADVIRLVQKHFPDHPGTLDGWWLPTTRQQALAWLREFLAQRFSYFGDYEDALSIRDPFLFHSILSPMLNLGLLTPEEIIERALVYAKENNISINSLEGFVRQIIGWREFIRGIYQKYSTQQESTNFFNHHRRMKDSWWTGETGLLPLDDTIKKAIRYGWTHHIERLMILANLMNLCEINPKEVHDWFMAMFVDSSDWVMGPNVYGMGLMSDGGIFATKPYICGSNYILKMSDYTKPKANVAAGLLDEPSQDALLWTEIMDGLYWRFIDRHRAFFSSNPRMSMMSRSLDKMKPDRKERLFNAAEQFIEKVTLDGNLS